MQLPISRSLWLWSYLAPFLRYGDFLAKNCLFCLPLSHSAPSLPMFPLEFRGEVNREETRIMWLSEDCMLVAGVVLAWYQRVTDDRTVGRTKSIIANTALCWRAVKSRQSQCTVLARGYAMVGCLVVCLSVCPYVCLSVTLRPGLLRHRWSGPMGTSPKFVWNRSQVIFCGENPQYILNEAR